MKKKISVCEWWFYHTNKLTCDESAFAGKKIFFFFFKIFHFLRRIVPNPRHIVFDCPPTSNSSCTSATGWSSYSGVHYGMVTVMAAILRVSVRPALALPDFFSLLDRSRVAYNAWRI